MSEEKKEWWEDETPKKRIIMLCNKKQTGFSQYNDQTMLNVMIKEPVQIPAGADFDITITMNPVAYRSKHKIRVDTVIDDNNILQKLQIIRPDTYKGYGSFKLTCMLTIEAPRTEEEKEQDAIAASAYTLFNFDKEEKTIYNVDGEVVGKSATDNNLAVPESDDAKKEGLKDDVFKITKLMKQLGIRDI